MCGICQLIHPADPKCSFADLPSAALFEGADAPGDASTSYAISPGDTFQGTISGETDMDWVRIDMVAGTVYTVTMTGTGATPLLDTLLVLYDSTGQFVTFNDDRAQGDLSSEMQFTATADGTYYINAQSYYTSNVNETFVDTGDYVISVSSSDAVPVVLDETTDAAANTSTSYAITPDDTFVGNLSDGSDQDWIRVTLQAGEYYQITLVGAGLTPLQDPYLSLYDASGALITDNDDRAYGDLTSALTYSSDTGGTFYLSARSYYTDNPDETFVDTGDYVLEITQIANPLDGLSDYTHDQIATQLTDTGWPYFGLTRHAFDVAPGGTLTYNVTAMNVGGQAFARAALQAWTNVTGIQFSEVTGAADITFDHNDTGLAAYANTSVSGGITQSSTITITRDWIVNDWDASTGSIELDSYSFQTFIHEIGHALGLAHAGNYNGSALFPTDALYLNDSWQATVMSYFSQTENTAINADYAYILTPMIADIIAVHDLYGAPTDIRSGDTTYGWGSTAGNYLDDLFDLGQMVAFTLFDTGGTDTLDVSGFAQDQRIDLTPESLSDIGGLTGNLSIARGTVIENATGGDGADRLTGNSVDNLLSGGDGLDTLIGNAGNDTLIGGTSTGDLRDVLYGGEGADNLDGGYGNDELRGDAGNDTIVGGFGVDDIFGGMGDDQLTGQAWSDLIFGGTGSDFINGGFGYDRVNGGADADRFFHIGIFDHGSDWIQDYTAAQGDVLQFGQAGDVSQFQVNFTETAGAGVAGTEEAFVIYRPTGQILWALVDGAAQSEITLRIAGVDYDLLG